MKYLPLNLLLTLFLISSVAIAGDPVTPTQKTVVPQGDPVQKTVPMGDPVQKNTVSQKSSGDGGQWVYIPANVMAQIRDLERRQNGDGCQPLRTIGGNLVQCAIQKAIGRAIEELIPDLPTPGPPGPGLSIGQNLTRRQERILARQGVNVQAPFVSVQVPPVPAYNYAVNPASNLPAPPPLD